MTNTKRDPHLLNLIREVITHPKLKHEVKPFKLPVQSVQRRFDGAVDASRHDDPEP